MTITHQTVLDSEGQPSAVLIPWIEFLEIQKRLEGDDVTDEEAEALREAEGDRMAGNHAAFMDIASLKAELSL